MSVKRKDRFNRNNFFVLILREMNFILIINFKYDITQQLRVICKRLESNKKIANYDITLFNRERTAQ